MRLILSLFTIMALSSACTTMQFGEDININQFTQWVKPGSTSQEQVRSFLGEPTSLGAIYETDGKIYDRWTYYYGKGKLTRLTEADFKTLEIRFDGDKKVKTYNWSEQIKKPKQKK